VFDERFSKATMTGQAAFLQLGEALDNFLAIPAFSGFPHSSCGFVRLVVQVFEQLSIGAEPLEDEFSFRGRWARSFRPLCQLS
jgi:hypothetical protein